MNTGTEAIVGVAFLSAVCLRMLDMVSETYQKEGAAMNQTGLLFWTKNAILACSEFIRALSVSFVASVLAA